MLDSAIEKLNNLGKVYFDLEFDDGTFYKGIRFTKHLNPVYVNEFYDNQILYGYDNTFKCYDTHDNEVIIQFNQGFKIVKAYQNDNADMTDFWTDKVCKFLDYNNISPAHRDIQEAFVSEWIKYN
ncbi:hypothetical protein [Priestia megaterium]|uniref:hypothetical protein n=1 Tax=Priestia megaterium TaxID=1404 RepID=UPI002877B5B7|nr:hypothetical protein [Priestia megaterium]